jgi:hypothetical protein
VTDLEDGIEASRMVLRHLAGRDFPARSPLYAVIARGAVDDDEVLALTAGVPRHELAPMRLLAAVRFLLIGAPDEPLAAYHADLCATPRDPADAYPVFRDFVLRHRDEVAELTRTRAVQTNEVQRCACYMPAVAAAGEALGAELGLVDVGSSAGLAQLLDTYAYDYGSAGVVGPAGAAVRLRCEVRGAVPVPLAAAPPRIAHRIGLDRAPVDLRDDEAVRWLRACVWPGQGDRAETLVGAIAAARTAPPEIVTGDAVDDLPALLAAVPEGLGICVTTSVVLSYLGERRDDFIAVLEEAGRRRPIAWVTFDTAFGIDALDAAPAWLQRLREESRLDCALVRISLLTGSGREDRWLACGGYHGEWLDWRWPES